MATVTERSLSFISSEVGSIEAQILAYLDVGTKWLSCNGEVMGIGPTIVFASAAALFLYHELDSAIFVSGDQAAVSSLEKTLVSSMVLGILALMIHIWVCAMRFFQYYLDSIIRDSPDMLLQMTTAGLISYKPEMLTGPLTKFLKHQQPQIHITICWFLSLCYADYVRKHYCHAFNMPYLEQWQTRLHERVSVGVHSTVNRINSFVSHLNGRLRGCLESTEAPITRPSSSTVTLSEPKVGCLPRPSLPDLSPSLTRLRRTQQPSNAPHKIRRSSHTPARRPSLTPLRNCDFMSRLLGALVLPRTTTQTTPVHEAFDPSGPVWFKCSRRPKICVTKSVVSNNSATNYG